MNTKYVMVGGLAFSEENDMKMLSKYAKEGWILDRIVGGFFYKLKKDTPKDIIYSLDYQDEATKEYFDLFLEAGWTLVISIAGKGHIFSAPIGTKPIYSEKESTIDKYYMMKEKMKKSSICFLISMIIFAILSFIIKSYIKPIYFVTFSLFIISYCAFAFSFMPYLAYSYRVKKIVKSNKYGINFNFNTELWKFFAFLSAFMLFLNIECIIEKNYIFLGIGLVFGLFNIAMTIHYYKKGNGYIK